MSNNNRTVLIVIVIIAALVLLFTNPSPIYSVLGLINTVASTVFFIVATIWIARKL